MREDREIIHCYLKREEKAIRYTSEKYGARLRSISKTITRDALFAEECENDTYLKTWEAIPPHEPYDYFFAFLARITRHLSLDVCKNRLRAKRSAELSEFTSEMEECIPSPDDTVSKIEAKLLGEAISEFLWRVPTERRMIFLRRYWYLESVAEICARFAISESKVKSALFRTRNELRAFLIKEGYEL